MGAVKAASKRSVSKRATSERSHPNVMHPSAELVLPLIRKSREFEMFRSEWKVLPSSAILGYFLLEEHFESLIGRKEASFHSTSSCIDHINTLRIIVEQCPGGSSG